MNSISLAELDYVHSKKDYNQFVDYIWDLYESGVNPFDDISNVDFYWDIILDASPFEVLDEDPNSGEMEITFGGNMHDPTEVSVSFWINKYDLGEYLIDASDYADNYPDFIRKLRQMLDEYFDEASSL